MQKENIIKVIIFMVFAWLVAAGASLFMRVIDEPLFNFLNNTPALDQKEEVVSAEPKKEETLTFVFGGDVMLSRQVGQRMVKYNDYLWPFSMIKDELSQADLTVVNLESPFIYDQDYFVPTGSFMFKADPRAVMGLEIAGIDLVSLANNHFANAGRQGMLDTFSVLDQAGISYIGAGVNEEAARAGVQREIGGHPFAFVAFAYPQDHSLADEETAGIVGMDLEAAAADVRRLADEGNSVIVFMHAGTEYTREPNWQQQEFARAMIDAGASLVVGHHPHWPQITEIYQDRLIIYSLGNLVFDQMWSLETRQGLIAKVYWQASQGFYKAEFIPVLIEDYGQPVLMSDGKQVETLFKALELPSDGQMLIGS